ncbi:MAG TPA: DUF4157 domain-containing protein [Bryobacteraceae bacterium]
MQHAALESKQKTDEASGGKTRQPNPVATVRHSIPLSAAGLGAIQRKCASQGAAGIVGLHTASGNRAVMGLMRRAAGDLPVSQPGDLLEQEADRTADTVMSESPVQVQRKCACDQDDERQAVQRKEVAAGAVPAVPAVSDVVRSPGGRLDAGVRAFMEQRFGQDFGHVAVHTDSLANASARALNAHAYTIGSHVVFGAGLYSPHSGAGRKLLAHELAHVVQQSGCVVPGMVQRQSAPFGAGGGFHGQMERDRIAQQRGSPPSSGSSAAEQQEQRAEAAIREAHNRGVVYGLTLAEAAENVGLHNQDPVPDDWDLVPSDRRSFIEFVQGRQEGPWRLRPPAVSIADPARLQSFLDGVNAGLESHASMERFFAPIAEALQLLSMALATSSMMRGFAPPVAGAGPPRLRVIPGGGGRAPRIITEPIMVSPASPPPRMAVAAGRGPVAAAVAEPVPLVEPVPAPAPRRLTLIHSQPEAAVVPRPRPQPASPPMRAPVPLPGLNQAREGNERSRDGRSSMRHQIQRGADHHSSVSVTADPRIGVTVAQLRTTMAANFARFMSIASGAEPVPRGWVRGQTTWDRPIRSAIIAQSQAIGLSPAAGGVTEAGDINALRRCFDPGTLTASPRCVTNDVRLDIENRGHNLRT